MCRLCVSCNPAAAVTPSLHDPCLQPLRDIALPLLIPATVVASGGFLLRISASQLKAQKEATDAQLKAQKEATDAQKESTDAQLKALKEATDAQKESTDAQLKAQKEATDAQVAALKEIAAAYKAILEKLAK